MNNKVSLFQLTLDSLRSHVAILDGTGTIVSVNQAWRDFAHENGIAPENVSEGINYLVVCDSASGDDAAEATLMASAIRKIISGQEEAFTIEYPCHSPTEKRWFIARVTRFHVDQSTYVVIHHENITARKVKDDELIQSKRFLENLLRTTPSAIFTVDTNQIITSWNQKAERITGYKAEEVIGQKCSIIDSPTCKDGCRLFDDHYVKPGEFRECELITKGGRRVFILKNYDLLYNNEGKVTGGIESFIDITERREAEQRLRLHGTALEAAANGIIITDKEGLILWVNNAWCEMTGYSFHEAVGKNPRMLKSELQFSQFYQDLWDTILSGQVWRGELINKRKDGSLYTEEETITPFKAMNGDITHFIAIKQDITPRKFSEKKIQAQISQLAALREIDQAIASMTDLNQSLDLILSLSTNRLNVDAATILLMDPDSQTLVYAAGKGFVTAAIEQARVKPEESFLSRSGLKNKIVQLPDEALDYSNFFLSDYLKAEQFVKYYAAPLMVKGELIGLMEIFHRSHLERDEEWLNFFTMLAGQAAIAIDSAQMFEKLTKTNQELINAYNATIEGWSYALDLRDNETEGHSKRVTELVVRLARLLGVNNGRLEQIRRGAILHDIGKMGVPDYILLKPGKLTDEEYEIIKKHPVYSYEMLSSIPFLKPALDIPYSHHENWDGSGYPQGLKGEQIPFAARMFALIDVYDALTSDRPYRKAWKKEDALAYIQEQSGIKFDPNLVPKFLEMLGYDK